MFPCRPPSTYLGWDVFSQVRFAQEKWSIGVHHLHWFSLICITGENSVYRKAIFWHTNILSLSQTRFPEWENNETAEWHTFSPSLSFSLHIYPLLQSDCRPFSLCLFYSKKFNIWLSKVRKSAVAETLKCASLWSFLFRLLTLRIPREQFCTLSQSQKLKRIFFFVLDFFSNLCESKEGREESSATVCISLFITDSIVVTINCIIVYERGWSAGERESVWTSFNWISTEFASHSTPSVPGGMQSTWTSLSNSPGVIIRECK